MIPRTNLFRRIRALVSHTRPRSLHVMETRSQSPRLGNLGRVKRYRREQLPRFGKSGVLTRTLTHVYTGLVSYSYCACYASALRSHAISAIHPPRAESLLWNGVEVLSMSTVSFALTRSSTLTPSPGKVFVYAAHHSFPLVLTARSLPLVSPPLLVVAALSRTYTRL